MIVAERSPSMPPSNGLADDGRISVEGVRPETIGEDDDAGGLGAVILRPDEAPEHRTKAHHLEIGPVDDSAVDFARLAESDEREGDAGEVAELAEGLDPRLEVPNFRHRPGAVFLADARRALPDINQPILVAVDQRLDEHAAHQREDGGVGADAQRERDDHDKRKPRRFAELAKSETNVV